MQTVTEAKSSGASYFKPFPGSLQYNKIEMNNSQIDRLSCTFKSPVTYAGYYIKATINGKVNGYYEAHFAILDDTECVEFGEHIYGRRRSGDC